MSLELKSVPTPFQDAPLPVFRRWVRACCHLCDHILTQPEACGWAELLSEPPVDLTNKNACFRLAKKAWREDKSGAPLQSLYDGYTEEIALAVSSGFWVQDGWQRKHLSIRGVAAVTSDEQGVHSAYLPGLGTQQGTVEGQDMEFGLSEFEIRESRKTRPLPRQVGKESEPSTPGENLEEELAPLPDTSAEADLAAYRRYRSFLRGVDWLSLEALHVSRSELVTAMPPTEDAMKELSDAQWDFVHWRKLEDSARGAT